MGDRFDFAGDERGVSGVIGFILIFAILVILLSINQAQVVPQENAQVEFQHFKDVRGDLVDVRSAILTAGQNDVSQFPTVNLGTEYPPRILAVNPPPASGTLETSDAYDIIITDETGTTERIETRFLEYRPNYNELDVGSTWYENSMLYLDEREQGGLVIIEEQDLVPEGGNGLRITALQNEYRRSGSGRVALELYPSETADIENLTGELDVTLPTRLTADEYWTEAFEDEPAFDPTVESVPYPAGIQALNLTVQKDNLTINTVGVQSMPDGRAAKENVGMGEPTKDPTETQLLRGVSVDTSNNDLIYSMENTGPESITLQKFSINASPIQSGITIESSTNDNEIEIIGSQQNGYARTKNNAVISAEGKWYDFKEGDGLNPGNGEYAVIDPGEEVTVDIREFSERLDNDGSNPLVFSNEPSGADLIISFELANGSIERLYFKQN